MNKKYFKVFDDLLAELYRVMFLNLIYEIQVQLDIGVEEYSKISCEIRHKNK